MTSLCELTPADIDHFIEYGFVLVQDCIDGKVMQSWVEQSWERMGYDPGDRSTWREEKVHMPARETRRISEIAPRALAAMGDLHGGVDRLVDDLFWGDALIVNYCLGRGKPWVPPSREAEGWHVDGDFFLHFLDSSEQALLAIVFWDDVLPKSGATFLACDSVRPVARFLASHPEGIEPKGFPMAELLSGCTDFREATGRAGDLYLAHPLMAHAASYNPSPRARFISNPCPSLKAPMRFDRDDPGDQSAVERATLRALGARQFSFQPLSPRRRIVPRRVADQARMREEEERRCAALSAR